jgi:hypothetical protein
MFMSQLGELDLTLQLIGYLNGHGGVELSHEHVWSYLQACYPRQIQNIGVETLLIYQKELAHIPAGVLLEAARQHVAESEWFPSLAQLHRHIRHVVAHQEATTLTESQPALLPKPTDPWLKERQIWQAVKHDLGLMMDKSQFLHFFGRAELIGVVGQRLEVGVASPAIQQTIGERYLALVVRCLQGVAEGYEITFIGEGL